MSTYSPFTHILCAHHTFLHIQQLQMGSSSSSPGNYLSTLLALFSLLSTEKLLSQCAQQKAMANGSPEIMDVLVLNPSISSFNAEQPKASYRRELLLRTLQQRQQHQHSRTLSSSLLTRQRPARPYSQPVPKAKAIPGPILAKSGAKSIYKVKNQQCVVILLGFFLEMIGRKADDANDPEFTEHSCLAGQGQ